MSVLSSIVGLLDWSRPSNIPGFIMTIIVDAVNAMSFRWSWPESFEKLVERFESKFYSSAAVVRVAFRVLIAAPLASLVVYRIFRSFFVTACVTVLRVSLFDSLYDVATTRKRATSGKVLAHRRLRSSALADAVPERTFVLSSRVTNDSKPTEFLSGQILKTMMNRNLCVFENFKHRIILTLPAVLFIVSIMSVSSRAQDVITLPADDVKQLRRLAADRDYQKDRADEAEKQTAGWQRSSEKWKALYESEKNRADNVAGGEIAELRKENGDLRGALQAAKDQRADDRQKIGEQTARIIKLESSRKWYFVTGAILGTAGGVFAGYQVAKRGDTIIQQIPGLGSRPAFRASFAF